VIPTVLPKAILPKILLSTARRASELRPRNSASASARR
jgi:hypothetical protein